MNSRRIYKQTDYKKREIHLQSQIHAPVISKKIRKTTDAIDEDEQRKSYMILLL